MLKRIYAIVSDSDFYAFQRRAKEEGMDMGQAFAAITHAYALGHEVKTGVKQHKDHLDYIKAQEERTLHLKEVEQ